MVNTIGLPLFLLHGHSRLVTQDHQRGFFEFWPMVHNVQVWTKTKKILGKVGQFFFMRNGIHYSQTFSSIEAFIFLLDYFSMKQIILTRDYDNFLISILDYFSRTKHKSYTLLDTTLSYKITSRTLCTLSHYRIIESSISCSTLSHAIISDPIISYEDPTSSLINKTNITHFKVSQIYQLLCSYGIML